MMASAQAVNEKGKTMKTKKNKKRKTTSKTQVNHQKPLLEDDWLMEEIAEPELRALRFSPTAWAKLLYFRDRSHNEVGGFGVTDPDDLLFVQEFVTVKQEVTGVSVRFDDEAVSRFFDDQVDQSRRPEQFARLWLHTHPDLCPEPSVVDEDTFARVFGPCQWAVMCIVAQDDTTYARLSFNVGPAGQILIPTAIDYSHDFASSDREAWEAEYAANVKAVGSLVDPAESQRARTSDTLDGPAFPNDMIDEIERMDPFQRRLILGELSERPDLWDEEEVILP
jgi:hypothetical protein